MCQQVNPNMKAIFLLRDPAKRTRSGFLYSQSIFEEKALTMDADFEQELRGERDDFRPTLRHLNYSAYPTQLARWEAALKPGNMLILAFENFVRAPKDGLDKVCAFLGISPLETFPRAEQSNVTVALDTQYKPRVMQLLYTKNPLKSLLKPLLPGRLRQSLKTRVQDSLVSAPQAAPEVSAYCRQVMADRFEGMQDELGGKFGFRLQYWTSG